MKNMMLAAMAALALASPTLAPQREYPLPPGIQAWQISIPGWQGTILMAQAVRQARKAFLMMKRCMGSGAFSSAAMGRLIASFRTTFISVS